MLLHADGRDETNARFSFFVSETRLEISDSLMTANHWKNR